MFFQIPLPWSWLIKAVPIFLFCCVCVNIVSMIILFSIIFWTLLPHFHIYLCMFSLNFYFRQTMFSFISLISYNILTYICEIDFLICNFYGVYLLSLYPLSFIMLLCSIFFQYLFISPVQVLLWLFLRGYFFELAVCWSMIWVRARLKIWVSRP